MTKLRCLCRLEGFLAIKLLYFCLKGRVTDIQVLQTPDRRLSEEVVGALRRSPRWVPAQQDGRIVRVRYTIPVQFTIR